MGLDSRFTSTGRGGNNRLAVTPIMVGILSGPLLGRGRYSVGLIVSACDMDMNLGPDTSRGLEGVPGDSGRRRGLGSLGGLGGESEVLLFFGRVLSIKIGGGPLFLGWGFAGGGCFGASGAGVEAFFFRFGADFCFILGKSFTRAMSMPLSRQGSRQASTRILTKTQKGI